MTAKANPLDDLAPSKAGKVTKEHLQDLADEMNAQWWVREMGRYYYVGREANGDGGFRHFLTWSRPT